MEKTFVYFQPEYVNKFKCDGQKCKAHCCKYWGIDIDKQTYRKYNSIKPKTKAREIVDKIEKNQERNMYFVKMNKKNYFCPFLNDENLCYIQKNYGADYLSNTCMTYPRKTYRIGDFYEMTLVLSCPVAAELILNQKEPMSFEQTQVSGGIYFKNCRDTLKIHNIPEEIIKNFVHIQYAVISILQERRFTIDQRLIIAGYYFEQLDEIINAKKFNEIETLAMIFTSEEFLNEQAPILIKSIEFNVRDYMKIMFEFFGALYGENDDAKLEAQKYLVFVVNMLEIKMAADGTASITELVESYKKNLKDGKNFLEQYSYIFENYLVQEFFSCLYPFVIKGSATLNYGLFIATYKILELMAMSMAVVMKHHNKDQSVDEKKIIYLISWFIQKLDHSKDYIDPITKDLELRGHQEVFFKADFGR